MINSKTLYKIELLKLIKRKDIWVLFLIIGIPIFYSIGVYTNSTIITYESSEKEYALNFVVSMFEFCYMVFIFLFKLSLNTARTFAGEIDDKSILLFLPRINNRKKIYFCKKNAIITIFSLISLIFIIVTLLLYYLLVVKRTDIATNIFYIKDELIYLIARFISIYLVYIFVIGLSMCLSPFFKQISVVIFTAIVLVINMYMQHFPIIKYLSPTYYASEVFNFKGDNKFLLILLFGSILITTFYNIIFDVIGIKKFIRKDIS